MTEVRTWLTGLGSSWNDIAFDIEADGSLSERRVWAETGEDHPDGICVDAEGAVWYADVGAKRCVPGPGGR